MTLKGIGLAAMVAALIELPPMRELRPWEVEQDKVPEPDKRKKAKAGRKANVKRIRK